MAPLANEPRQVRVVLNLPKRKALYTLAVEITDWMRSQLILKNPNRNSVSNHANNNTPSQNGPPLPTRPNTNPNPRSQPSSGSGNDRIAPLRHSTLSHFDTWRSSLLQSLKEVLSPGDSSEEINTRQQRLDRLAQKKIDSPAPGENLIDFGDALGPVAAEDGKAVAQRQRKKEVEALQGRYHAIPTRLVSVAQEDREETVVCLLLLLLSSGKYLAESRTFLVYLCSALTLPLSFLNSQEAEVARSLVESSKSDEAQQMSAAKEAEGRKKANQAGRMWKVGLASVAGAAIIGVTGGLAAPAVAGVIGGLMGSVGLGGVASFLGVFWMNGALVGTLFGALGAQMTGEIVDQYAREVEDFAFLPLSGRRGNEEEKLRLTIGINGWLTESLSSLVEPWKALDGKSSNLFALRYEVAAMLNLGNALREMVTSAAWTYIKVELLKRTVLATLWSALWPVSLLSMASALDNPFSLAKNRSEKAGKILADALINRVQGERPVTLIGYSLGARVIYSCLRTLAERRAFGLVDEAILIGAPVPSDRDAWEMMRSVVSGKLWNVCSGNDYLLGFIYRTSSIQLGVAGLQEIKGIEGVENLDLTGTVKGHVRYPEILGKILERCGVEIKEGYGGKIEAEQDLTREEEIVLADMEAQGKIPASVATKMKGKQSDGLIDFGDNEQQQQQQQQHRDPPPQYAVMDPRAASSRSEQQEQAPPKPPRPQAQRNNVTKPTSSLQASSSDPLASSSSKPADDDFFSQFFSGPSKASNSTKRPQPPQRSSTTSSALSDLAALSISSSPQKPTTTTPATNTAKVTDTPSQSSKPSSPTSNLPKAMNPHLLATLLTPHDQPQKPLGRSSTTSTGSRFSTVREMPAIQRANTAPPKPEIPWDIPLVTRPAAPVQSKSEQVVRGVDDDSDDETGGYGIRMVDNEGSDGGELEFAEPIPIEDDDYHRSGNWR